MPFCVPFTRAASKAAIANISDDNRDDAYGEKSSGPCRVPEPDAAAEDVFSVPSNSAIAKKPTLMVGQSAERLRDVRTLMTDKKVDYYVVTSADEHDSEYVNLLDRRREYISGFTGSAGVAVIPSASSREKGLLMVDSRYWIQAAQQVQEADWRVVRSSGSDFTALMEFCSSQVEEHSRVGIDPKYITAIQARTLQSALIKRSSTLVPLARNLIDAIHTPASLPIPLIELHPIRYSGKSAVHKLNEARVALFRGEGGKKDVYVLPVLPSIAWLLNIRCQGEIPDVPVVKGYVCLTPSTCVFFVDGRKLTKEVAQGLEQDGVQIRPYGIEEVVAYAKQAITGGIDVDAKATGKIYAPAELSWALSSGLEGILPSTSSLVVIPCPIDIAKAIKNPVELDGFRAAYLRDGVATVRWMAWIREAIAEKGEKIHEWDAGQKLMEFRSKEAEYRGASYDPISGSGPNGALPHYAPTRGADRIIDTVSTYVNDSGAQYRDGTIDTTRTMHFGKPTAFQKRAFTRVVQGHLTVAATPFAVGTNGAQLGALGTQFLALDGLKCSHGIGHGVGSYLSVHEGPQGFGGPVALQPGHVLTDEPGVYIEGHWGIRHESAYVVVPIKTRYHMFGEFYGFERFTQVPIQVSLLDLSIMSKEQIEWVKLHNESVVRKVLPHLSGNGDRKVREWLKKVNEGL